MDLKKLEWFGWEVKAPKALKISVGEGCRLKGNSREDNLFGYIPKRGRHEYKQTKE